MRRLLLAASAVLVLNGGLFAAEKGEEVTLGGMKSTAPAEWKVEPPANEMRVTQFKLAKVAGDPEDAALVVFYFRAGSGSVEQNFKRQEAKFDLSAAKKDAVKVTKIKVGPLEGHSQDITGTFLSKFPPFAPNAKITRKNDYRQIYVVFSAKDGEYYVSLLGPAKTVAKYKDGFDNWLKNFK